MTDTSSLPERCLVTGATGFIGSHVLQEVRSLGIEVYGTTRRAAELCESDCISIDVDLTDAASVRRILDDVRPDAIVHCAAGSSSSANMTENRDSYRDTVEATRNLVIEATRTGVEVFVHLGSALEYGPSGAPLTEDADLHPITERGFHKAAATQVVLTAPPGTRATTVLRPFRVYGSGEAHDRLIPRLVDAVTGGRPLPVTRHPGYRDYVHVSDVARACLLALARTGGPPTVVNVATGIQTSVDQLLDVTAQIIGRPVERTFADFPDRPIDSCSYVADITRARETLAWQPRVSLMEGLAALLFPSANGGSDG